MTGLSGYYQTAYYQSQSRVKQALTATCDGYFVKGKGYLSQSRVRQALTATDRWLAKDIDNIGLLRQSQSRVRQALTATLERSRLIHKAPNFENPANKNIYASKPHGCMLCSMALGRQQFAHFPRYSRAKEPLPVLNLLKYPKMVFMSTLYFLFQLTYTFQIPRKLILI